ncbi:MAG: HlyC/CorC family transporter [Desulfovibrio sp.]|nr:MAG: HlyC/CorC family transporter [Desulfovibrio sp.]
MDEGSEGRFLPFLSRLFSSKSEDPVEKSILEASEDGELKGDEVSMLLNVLRLGRKCVEEIIIPRTDIVCVEASSSVQDVVGLIMDSGHSRIPVYKDNRDNIVGIVHAKDLLCSFAEAEKKGLDCLMRKPFFIPETKNIKDLLQEFRSRKIHLAIALDEYGGTSGLVTFEDVLEEIVGEIEDEYDTPRPEDIQVLDSGEVLVSGRTPLEDVAERFGLTLASEQVETIGGYLCELAGKVPAPKESFSLEGHRFLIKEADAKTVRSILITPPKKTT